MKTLWATPLLAAALILAPAANADDTGYLELLEQYGIPYTTPQKALHAAHITCEEIGNGMTYYQAVYHLGMGAEIPTPTADRLVAAAITEICPQYQSVIPA